MALVVDASVALAWALPDESSAYADAALSSVESSIIRVPEIWPREIANGLAVAYLRRRITIADEQVHVEQADVLSVIRTGTAMAARFGLTAYDAAYVDLALREGLTLATLDGPMRRAAQTAGVSVFEP